MPKKSITLSKIGNRIKWLFYSVVPFFISKIRVGKKSESPFLITIKTSHEYNRAVTFYDKEPEMLEWINSLPSYGLEKFVFWDIGANIGWYVLNLAATFPDLRIEAFEPVPPTFAQLRRNVELNNLGARIAIHNAGLSNEGGTFTVYFYGEGSGNASLQNPTGSLSPVFR